VTLGLFPLNLVLFPGTQVPLHIFEPRYRTLIRECREGGSTFGINLVDHGHLHPVGCFAMVAEVTEEYDDGRMDVLVEGSGRYRILDVNETSRPYVVGEVEPIEDDIVPVDPTLVADCASLYNQIIDLVYGTDENAFDAENIGERSPSFLMAPKSGLTSEQKQHLLEMTSENQRLEMLRDHLAEIVPTVRKAELIQRIVKSDGYLPAIED